MKKKALLLMLVLVFISTNALAQNTIYGNVSGDVQESVTVAITKVACGATNQVAELTTDSDGNYSSLSLEDGRYMVNASKDGYSVSPNLHDLQIPQTVIQSYDFTATAIRFIDNGDGTVTDILTNLVWLKNASCFGEQNWNTSTSSAEELNSGECGLSDNSMDGDWRLPALDQLMQIGTDPLIVSNPLVGWTIPSVPFFNVQPNYYWSNTEDTFWYSYHLNMADGSWSNGAWGVNHYVWPVRDAN